MRKLLKHEVERRIEQTGMRPFAFAKAYGITPESLRKWLKGLRSPKIQHIQKLAGALNCDISDISKIAIKIDQDKIKRRNAIIEEMDAFSVYLTDQELQAILNLVRAWIEGRRKEERKEQQES